MKHTRVVSLNARQAKPGVHLVDTTRVCFIVNEHTTKCSCFITLANLKCKNYIHLCHEICIYFNLKVGNSFCSLYQVDWWNFIKQSVIVGAQLLWSGRYGCNNSRYGCAIVMSCIERNKAASQWLLTFNLCVSVTWPLTCAFHIPCTHTPEIIDMHRGVCDNTFSNHLRVLIQIKQYLQHISYFCTELGRFLATRVRNTQDRRSRRLKFAQGDPEIGISPILSQRRLSLRYPVTTSISSDHLQAYVQKQTGEEATTRKK